MYHWHRSWSWTALALVLSACASGPQARSTSSNRSVLTEQEIQSAGYTDAHAIVQSLRPQWLIARGGSSLMQSEPVRVYLDDSRLGGVDMLRNLTVSQIALIRYYTGIEASERWGLDHGGGAIQVLTRRGR